LEPFTIFCEYIRVVPAIDRSKSPTYYWMVFYFGKLNLYSFFVISHFMKYSMILSIL